MNPVPPILQEKYLSGHRGVSYTLTKYPQYITHRVTVNVVCLSVNFIPCISGGKCNTIIENKHLMYSCYIPVSFWWREGVGKSRYNIFEWIGMNRNELAENNDVSTCADSSNQAFLLNCSTSCLWCLTEE